MGFSTNFIPSSQTIANITNNNPGVVTTDAAHGYETGIFVRIVLPQDDFGMQQVNNQIYKITVLTNFSFAINQDTTNFDSFALGSNNQVPQVIPVGNIDLSLLLPEQNNNNIIPET